MAQYCQIKFLLFNCLKLLLLMTIRVTGANEADKIRSFKTCLESLGVQEHKVVQNSPPQTLEYEALVAEQWNERFSPVHPKAYLLPTTSWDVQAGVKCGVQIGIRLSPLSGGHSYEGLGYGTNQSVIIDFRNMQGISVVGTEASIQPGALLGQVHPHLWRNGGLGLGVGNCLGVGIGGHALGGGVGYFSGAYGLLIDNVLEYTIVTASGDLVVANSFVNPDLFWALRGVGPGGLGIVTSVRVKTFHASQIKITIFRARYSTKYFAEVMEAFQNFLLTSSERVFTSIFVSANPVVQPRIPLMFPGIDVTAVHIFDPNLPKNQKDNSSFRSFFKSAFPEEGRVYSETYPSYLSFVAELAYYPEGQNLSIFEQWHLSPGTIPSFKNDEDIANFFQTIKKAGERRRYFKAKGFFVNDAFPLGKLQTLTPVVVDIPRGNNWILISSERGAISSVPPTAMAYPHRQQLYDFSIHYEGVNEPKAVETGMHWLDKMWDAMQFMDGGGTYQNYPDLDVKDYLQRFYGPNLGRMLEAKRKWDPGNIFQNLLSIPVDF